MKYDVVTKAVAAATLLSLGRIDTLKRIIDWFTDDNDITAPHSEMGLPPIDNRLYMLPHDSFSGKVSVYHLTEGVTLPDTLLAEYEMLMQIFNTATNRLVSVNQTLSKIESGEYMDIYMEGQHLVNLINGADARINQLIAVCSNRFDVVQYLESVVHGRYASDGYSLFGNNRARLTLSEYIYKHMAFRSRDGVHPFAG